jgi:hypothetical protein
MRLAREGLDALPWNDAARRFRYRCLFVGRYGRHGRWPDFSSGALMDDQDLWLLPFGNWEGGAVFTGESLLQALMGRYPRRYWPDDPRAAKPTAQAKKKKEFP